MFGDKLKLIRKSKGFTLDSLAELYNKTFDAGLNKGTLSKYENNKQEPMISVVDNLATLLGVSVDFLLDKIPPHEQHSELKKEELIPCTSNEDEPIELTQYEQKVISAYRKQPEMQPAVDRLLGLEEKKKTYKYTFVTAARGKGLVENTVETDLSPEDISRISKAPGMERDDDLF